MTVLQVAKKTQNPTYYYVEENFTLKTKTTTGD